jgi:hypothetical protein
VALSAGLFWCARLEQVPPQPPNCIAPYFSVLTPLCSVFSGRFQVEPSCVHFGLPQENGQLKVDIASLPAYLHLSSVRTMCCRHYLCLNSLSCTFLVLLDFVCTLSHFLFLLAQVVQNNFLTQLPRRFAQLNVRQVPLQPLLTMPCVTCA